jgi:hypothetical protein
MRRVDAALAGALAQESLDDAREQMELIDVPRPFSVKITCENRAFFRLARRFRYPSRAKVPMAREV